MSEPTQKSPPKLPKGMKLTSKAAIRRAMRNTELQREHAERVHRAKMLRRRISLAQSGVHAFENKRITEAVRCFHLYLRILEDWKGVKEGQLRPAHFDREKDISELLLISGVYWDLAKLYDRTKTPERIKDFYHYLNQYILFAKGMPFAHVCRETMRKYLANDKAIHKADFRNAYKEMGGVLSCYVATALADVTDAETLHRLRAFRDMRLKRNSLGRAFTLGYYKIGPALAGLTLRFPIVLRRCLGSVLDRVSFWLAP